MDETNETNSQPLEEAPEPKDTNESLLESQVIAEGTLEGQVSNAEGSVADASVSVGLVSTLTDSKGKFVLEYIPPGIVRLRVTSPTSRFNNSATDIIVEAGKRKEVFVFLTEIVGSVEGAVTDESGKPLPGAEVSSLFRLGRESLTAKTDEKGYYVFHEIPRGSYFVRAKAKGFMSDGQTVNVIEGKSAVADYKLKSGNLSISGKVVNNDGGKVECELHLLKMGIIVTRVKLTTEGSEGYVFSDLVSGDYEIGVLAPGYNGKGWRGKLEKNEVVDFVLEHLEENTQTSGYG